MYNWFRFSTGKNMVMKMLQALAIFLIPMLLHLFSCITCAQDAMMPNQTIRDGQTLVSSGRTFELGFFSPIGSNSRYLGIWYRNIPDHTVVWTANRESPLASSTGTLALTAAGNLIICNHSGDIMWSTRTSSTSIPIVQLLDSGNLVLIGGKSLLWQSFDHLTNTLVPGMKLGIDLKSNLSRQLSSWRSTADPSQGAFTYKVDPHGSGEIILWNGSIPMFRTGPWNGQAASGFPLIRWSNLFTVTFTSNQDEIYYEYEVVNKSIQWRVLLTPNGIVQRWVLMDPSDGWSLYFSLPMDQCDEYAQCGPYGVCNTNDWPVCKCLWGFEPKSGEEWALRDGTHGCVRRTKLDCESGDGFLKMSRVKLPDTTNATMDGGASLDECKERCRRNCACKAFAAITLEGTGCFIWFGDLMDIKEFTEGGQDLYVRLAVSELGKHIHKGCRETGKSLVCDVSSMSKEWVSHLSSLLLLLINQQILQDPNPNSILNPKFLNGKLKYQMVSVAWTHPLPFLLLLLLLLLPRPRPPPPLQFTSHHGAKSWRMKSSRLNLLSGIK